MSKLAGGRQHALLSCLWLQCRSSNQRSVWTLSELKSLIQGRSSWDIPERQINNPMSLWDWLDPSQHKNILLLGHPSAIDKATPTREHWVFLQLSKQQVLYKWAHFKQNPAKHTSQGWDANNGQMTGSVCSGTFHLSAQISSDLKSLLCESWPVVFVKWVGWSVSL